MAHATLCYMTTISHRDMRNHSAEVLRRVAAGESFIITNNGEPVASLTPMQRSVLDDLQARGQLRRALHGPEALLGITRATAEDGATTAEIIADSRGPW